MIRYFKYRNVKKNYLMALREQYNAVDKCDRQLIRRERAWRRLATILMCLILACLYFLVQSLLKMIPLPDRLFLRVLAFVGLFILALILDILSAYISYILMSPLFRKAEKYSLPAIKKETLSKATVHLRKYYELNAPYLLTKCFDASDKKWIDHDVCIFIAYNELRITTDLIHGFLYGERDLGCYAFRRSEITLSKCAEENRLKLELRAGDTFFVLGYRAKSFIEKNFINR